MAYDWHGVRTQRLQMVKSGAIVVLVSAAFVVPLLMLF